ncbi:MAG: 30S ribosomal protein S12 methylthiotransferase RimO [Coriobacteriia bacterium]|nr:30S ribosomal protein S12 methylthiotransferase RimO [Coriobacteriia bacterium]
MGRKAVSFITLGCAKNEVDTQHMRNRVLQAGYAVVDDPTAAHAIVINTCSFIQDATEESLAAVFEAAGYPNVAKGDAKIVVTGCMPARYGEELAEELVEAACFVPCSKEDDIAAVLGECIGAADAGPVAADAFDYSYVPTAGPFSAYVKISDGCNRFCSYCTIPFIRGRYRSFPFEDIDAEVRAAVDAGVREIILIAQDTGNWGTDFALPSSLAWLMDALASAYPETWFRVMYVQPEGITDELLQVMAAHVNICHYLDIPLQHVNPGILRAMNRRGSRAEFDALAARIRAAVPDITLRTTLIAGFPGETDEQFQQLCDFVEECDFDYVGVFAYSREEGTKAYDLPGQLDEAEKRDRAQTVRDLADAVCTARCAERIGTTAQVLVEGFEEDGQLYGRAQFQAPEVDGSFYVDAGQPGEVITAAVVDSLFYELEGERRG